ncbi:MAG: exonuclease domain-containing protein [Casimicrobiaceae bacterium]
MQALARITNAMIVAESTSPMQTLAVATAGPVTLPRITRTMAFVDLETTGMTPGVEAITEVGIVRVDVDPAGGTAQVTEWSSLVHPGRPIPPEIQAMTGITDAMVRNAPSFASLADRVQALCADAIFVAHNARFDYGFLKHAYARLGRRFSARVLCTVKLSRRLFPEAQGHGLDAVVARHGLPCGDRHRALGDARMLWAFVQTLHRTLAADTIDAAVRRILRTPSLPPHLPPDALDVLPESPGVYMFHGENALPLYIGKSRNLRERVGAHFSADYRGPTDSRLSAEIRRITYEETAGEVGALLREAALVKALLPAHNHALRRKANAGVLEVLATDDMPRFVPAAAVEPRELGGCYGPFSSRRNARESLHALAHAHRLCWNALGLERRAGPCFAHQVGKCAGLCVGKETIAQHRDRLLAALASRQVPAWPYPGMAVVYEPDALRTRVDAHVVRDWCWLGTARDEVELGTLLDAPPRPEFDFDIARVLIGALARRKLRVEGVPVRKTMPA